MLILTQDARARIAQAVVESLQGRVDALYKGQLERVNVSIGEAPFFEVTPDGVCLGLWVHMSPAAAQNLAAAVGAKYAGAWDGVTPVDAARFEDCPCYMCGYNGPGYYQARTHPCAAGYHAAVARLCRVERA